MCIKKLYIVFSLRKDVTDKSEMQLQAVLLEYEDLRDEIKKRMDQRTHISYFVIAMTSGALGLYMSLREPLILVFTPLILIYWLLIIDSSYTHHREIIQYIREKIEGMKLPMLIEKASDEEGWIYWETYYSKDRKRRYSSRFKIYVALSWIIYILCGLVLIYENVHRIFLFSYWIVYSSLLVWVSYKCLIYTGVVKKKKKNKKRRRNK